MQEFIRDEIERAVVVEEGEEEHESGSDEIAEGYFIQNRGLEEGVL